MVTDWDIKPRSSACHRCRERFRDRQAYYSALTFDEQGYRRADFCSSCWPQILGTLTVHSKWRGVFREPPPKPAEPIRKETVETLLRRFIETGDVGKAPVVYILAVMLERKRILVERDVRKDESGRLIRVYEHRRTGETFLVWDPGLKLGQLEEVQRQVAEMLGSAVAASPGRTEKSCQHASPESCG